MKRWIVTSLLCTQLLVANEYSDWLQSQQQSYSDFKKSHDEAFAQSLKKDWEAFQAMYNVSAYKKPKPKELPKVKEEVKIEEKVIDNSPIVKLKKIELPVIPKKLIPVKPIITPPKIKEPVIEEPIIKDEPIVVTKPAPKPVVQDPNIKTITFDFYSNPITIQYNKNISFLITQVNKEAITNFWSRMSHVDNSNLLKQVNYYVKTLQLNDWATYLFIHSISEKIYATSNMSNLLTWYMLTKMNYDVKVGYNTQDIYLMANMKHKLFQVAFFRINNEKYYILTPEGKKRKVASIYTYKATHEEAINPLSFEFKKPILFNHNFNHQTVSFHYNHEKYRLETKYSKDLIDFYKTFPQSDYKIYFDAQNSTLIAQSLLPQLKPLLKGKTEIEAVNMLLRFVQTGFAYKTDQDQFSYEKVFFPEETFFYPYSDCEDRAILFSYLVKNLLNLEVVGVKYSDHMASAIKLSTKTNLDGFNYKNERFTIADPTYINANVGVTMPKYVNQRFEIIQ